MFDRHKTNYVTLHNKHMHPVVRRQNLPLHTMMVCWCANGSGNTKSKYPVDSFISECLCFFFLWHNMNICPHSLTWHWMEKWLRPYSKPTFLCGIQKSSGLRRHFYSFVSLEWQGCRVRSNSRPRCLLERQRKWQRWNYHAFLFAPSVSCLQVYKESIEITHFGLTASQIISLCCVARYTHLDSGIGFLSYSRAQKKKKNEMRLQI